MTKEQLESILFNMLSKGMDISQITDYIREDVLGNPIMITNDSFRVLYLSSDENIDDEVWRQATEYHGFTNDAIQIFKNSSNAHYVLSEKKAIIYDIDLGQKIPRIICPIYCDSKILGLVTVIGYHHPVQESDIDNTVIFAKALSILLHQTESQFFPGMGLTDYYLKNLLDRNQNIGLLPDSQTKLKKYFQVFATPLPTDQIGKQYLSYLKESITSIVKGVNCFPYQNNMFILVNYNQEKVMRECIRKMEKIFMDFHLTAGTTNTFTNLYDLPTQYSLAVDVLNTTSKLHGLPAIRKLNHYIEFLEISRFSKEELKNMIAPEYLALEEYDQIHNMSVLETLIAYYNESLNINETAKTLSTHRNTIAYRLRAAMNILETEQISNSLLNRLRHSDYIRLWMQEN